MSGKQKHRGTDDSDSVADDKRRNGMEDMVLIAEGKGVKTNSGLLSYNSNVFATLITNARATREADENDVMTYRTRSESSQKLKLEMPNLKYKDVQLLVTCLQSICLAKDDITAVKALRILPLVDHFRMKRLKKICGNALYDSLVTLRKDLGTGCLSPRDVLDYLAAADQYNFDKVRKLCVDELAVNVVATNRKLVIRDKHINEKTKLKVLDKMFDNMDTEYENKLKQVRLDMDERCRLIEQRRDQFMEQLETWKNDLRQEVDDMVKFNEDAHAQLKEVLYQQKLVSRMDETLKETKRSLFNEMEYLKDNINFVIQNMETNEAVDDIDEMEATNLKDDLKDAMEKNKRSIEAIAFGFKAKVEQNLNVCALSAANVRVFSSANELQENVRGTIEELEEKVQTLGRNQIKYEEEMMAHEKTKAELLKMKLKEHKLNTWLKWAKPGADDEEKCQCFRHAVARK